MVGLSESFVGGQGALEVDTGSTDLLSSVEGADPVEDGGDTDAEGFGCGALLACDGGLCVACWCGLDEFESFIYTWDPDVF